MCARARWGHVTICGTPRRACGPAPRPTYRSHTSARPQPITLMPRLYHEQAPSAVTRERRHTPLEPTTRDGLYFARHVCDALATHTPWRRTRARARTLRAPPDPCPQAPHATRTSCACDADKHVCAAHARRHAAGGDGVDQRAPAPRCVRGGPTISHPRRRGAVPLRAELPAAPWGNTRACMPRACNDHGRHERFAGSRNAARIQKVRCLVIVFEERLRGSLANH